MNFNSLVNVILEEKEVLYEGRKIRYKDYFNDYKEYCFKRIKTVYDNPEGFPDDEDRVDWGEEITNKHIAQEQAWIVEDIEKHIKMAIRTGKREDRIIWLLRHLKFRMYVRLLVGPYSFDNLLGDLYPASDNFVIPRYYKEYLKRYYGIICKEGSFFQDRTNVSGAYMQSVTAADFCTSMEHYLSLPIPSIKEYRFENQTPEQVITHFSDLETEWRTQGNGTNALDVTYELKNNLINQFLTFDNGKYGWFDLRKASCREEGNSMGHCGNSPRAESGDTILSFRSIKKENKSTLTIPHLTFILTYNGSLTESKGRGNSKPIAKYHPYIVSLLLYKIGKEYLIKNILGGGYKPENNFKVSDLSKELYDKLIEQRPELK